eukprot:TRINITY_DN20440_c0_g2_i1.p1 TRINITY_DN20440_c0_g2~~TRINITY_DN20440_c0_g2_i1.p1  ORF type:complete len:101 (-),score=9.19 TRINITY_DN20440_c0_g2_i1:103-405(-)
MTIKEILDVHKFMLLELRNVVTEYQSIPSNRSLDPRTVAIAAQALVSIKVEEHYNFTSDDIEGAVMFNNESLALDADFHQVNIQMQTTMTHMISLSDGSP